MKTEAGNREKYHTYKKEEKKKKNSYIYLSSCASKAEKSLKLRTKTSFW